MRLPSLCTGPPLDPERDSVPGAKYQMSPDGSLLPPAESRALEIRNRPSVASQSIRLARWIWSSTRAMSAAVGTNLKWNWSERLPAASTLPPPAKAAGGNSAAPMAVAVRKRRARRNPIEASGACMVVSFGAGIRAEPTRPDNDGLAVRRRKKLPGEVARVERCAQREGERQRRRQGEEVL